MSTFELNIGLLVSEDDAVENAITNTWSSLISRASDIESYVRGQLTCKIRREWNFDEPTLVVSGTVSTDDTQGGFHPWLYQLAERFEQDCIAVYYPDEDKGFLIGPNAEAWGDFNHDTFVRY